MFRRPKKPASLFPANAEALLTAYGRSLGDRSTPSLSPTDLTFFSSDLVQFLVSLEQPAIVVDPTAAASELVCLAERAGEWALLGAIELIDAYLPTESDSERYQEAQEAWFAFLRASPAVDPRMLLRGRDYARYDTLFPGEL